MAVFIQNSVPIEAMQLPPEGEDSTEELVAWLHEMDGDWVSEKDGSIIIHTLEGDITAMAGDWILKSVENEYYPCKTDIFEKTYGKAEITSNFKVGDLQVFVSAEGRCATVRKYYEKDVSEKIDLDEDDIDSLGFIVSEIKRLLDVNNL